MSDKLRDEAEFVSALMDGQLRGDAFVRAVDQLDDDGVRDTWDTYHLVGEAMRSAATPSLKHDPEFLSKLRQELVSNTPENIAYNALPMRAGSQKSTMPTSANDPWWRRVVGLASVAVVGVLAWQGVALLNLNGSAGQAPQVAQLVAQPVALPVNVAGDTAPIMIRDPQLDAMLAAHRQLGGANALQTPAGFLRNATFNEGNR